jgi:shikimate dehydrogenase
MEVAPEDLAAAVAGARAMGFQGFNLSMPHKVTVIPLLDALGDSARVIGAVNCVVRRDNRLIGENTDGKGFLESLAEVLPPAGREIVLFGAGGAARAVAVELALAGARKITIVNRSRARGEELVGVLRAQTSSAAEFVEWTGDYAVPATADVVINGTSIGLYDGEARVSVALDSLRPGLVAADVVFSPPDTAFLREAKARGCTCIDGLGMLVNQGVIGVRHWTGVDPDVPAMRQALAEALGVSIA